MTVQCIFDCEDASAFTLTECTQFSLVRERYLPYSELRLTLPAARAYALPIRVRFSLNGQLLHDGSICTAEYVQEKGELMLRIRSRSYTAVLTGSQLIPGMHYDVTLVSLMTAYALPHITYQAETAAVDYILVKENTSMWDALTAYSYKLCGSYPYIRVPNELCVAPQSSTDTVLLPEDAVLTQTRRSDASELISRIDMANLDGQYGVFSRINGQAVLREITKVRQILFDRQFLYNPDDALKFRLACSNRRLRQTAVTYLGYCGEDIEDRIRCGSLEARVGKITLTCDRGILTTEDVCYFDDFCNPT